MSNYTTAFLESCFVLNNLYNYGSITACLSAADLLDSMNSAGL